jgi:3-hydroxy-9,10-secoandrosta-1,3,5(10)-triene-9,17-dione monooxygenase reductase component
MTGNETVASPAVESQTFRRVLGRFCTGVTVVTGQDDTTPVGFTCQSFAALSLEPPLVLFCPNRTSRAWPAIERSGRFCVNVLSEPQQTVSSTFGRRVADRFAGLRWTPAPSGSPVLPEVLAWIDCTVEHVHEAGDHYVVIGRVTTLEETDAARPLLFYQGAYANLDSAEPTQNWDRLLGWPDENVWL